MEYMDYLKLIVQLEKAERGAFLKMCVAKAVFSHIDLTPYDDEGVEELCQRVKDFYVKAGANVDLETFAFCIQDQINEGAYETPTRKCLKDALEQALKCAKSRRY